MCSNPHLKCTYPYKQFLGQRFPTGRSQAWSIHGEHRCGLGCTDPTSLCQAVCLPLHRCCSPGQVTAITFCACALVNMGLTILMLINLKRSTRRGPCVLPRAKHWAAHPGSCHCPGDNSSQCHSKASQCRCTALPAAWLCCQHPAAGWMLLLTPLLAHPGPARLLPWAELVPVPFMRVKCLHLPFSLPSYPLPSTWQGWCLLPSLPTPCERAVPEPQGIWLSWERLHRSITIQTSPRSLGIPAPQHILPVWAGMLGWGQAV